MNPNELSAADMQMLDALKQKSGKELSTALREAVNAYLDQHSEEDAGLDTECMKWCADQLQGQSPPSLEEVRLALSTIKGSVSDEIIAERDER